MINLIAVSQVGLPISVVTGCSCFQGSSTKHSPPNMKVQTLRIAFTCPQHKPLRTQYAIHLYSDILIQGLLRNNSIHLGPKQLKITHNKSPWRFLHIALHNRTKVRLELSNNTTCVKYFLQFVYHLQCIIFFASGVFQIHLIMYNRNDLCCASP